ncbi:MAG: hypothetical protein WKF78_07350 [Candidatus Limnocylindrales bacterium]
MVDSDLRSIVPEWVELLAGPILKGGYDFVAPLYARYKYDGTITNTVTYPSPGPSTATASASRSAATSGSAATSSGTT